MADQENVVLTVSAVTGVDEIEAIRLLELHDWDAERAIDAYFQPETSAVSEDVLAGGNPLTHGQGVETEEVPLVYIPEDAFDVLGEDDSHLLRQNAGRRRREVIRRATKEKPIIEVFRDFKSEIDFKEKPARASGPRAALEVRSMSELFRPPVELLFPGNYDQARQYAEANGRLMLVNVQKEDNFDCQLMNRDTWKEAEVMHAIEANYVFWQVYSVSEEAIPYIKFYSTEKLPHVAVLEPATGLRLELWEGLRDPQQLAADLRRVYRQHKSGSAPAGDNASILDESEEVQMKAAVEASLQDKAEKIVEEEDWEDYFEYESDSYDALDEDGGGSEEGQEGQEEEQEKQEEEKEEGRSRNKGCNNLRESGCSSSSQDRLPSPKRRKVSPPDERNENLIRIATADSCTRREGNDERESLSSSTDEWRKTGEDRKRCVDEGEKEREGKSAEADIGMCEGESDRKGDPCELNLRLPDGKKLLCQQFHAHTRLREVYAYIREHSSLGRFLCATPYPRKELPEELYGNQRICDVGLAGRCALLVLQKD